MLDDVSTLYFETDTSDGFREPGFSKERRLGPQITIGLLTDAAGFPLMVNVFEGNKAETKTMLPGLKSFMTALSLSMSPWSPTPGCFLKANQHAVQDAKLSFILGSRISEMIPTGTCSPSPGRLRPRRRPAVGGTRPSTTVQGRPGPAHPTRDR